MYRWQGNGISWSLCRSVVPAVAEEEEGGHEQAAAQTQPRSQHGTLLLLGLGPERKPRSKPELQSRSAEEPHAVFLWSHGWRKQGARGLAGTRRGRTACSHRRHPWLTAGRGSRWSAAPRPRGDRGVGGRGTRRGPCCCWRGRGVKCEGIPVFADVICGQEHAVCGRPERVRTGWMPPACVW